LVYRCESVVAVRRIARLRILERIRGRFRPEYAPESRTHRHFVDECPISPCCFRRVEILLCRRRDPERLSRAHSNVPCWQPQRLFCGRSSIPESELYLSGPHGTPETTATGPSPARPATERGGYPSSLRSAGGVCRTGTWGNTTTALG